MIYIIQALLQCFNPDSVEKSGPFILFNACPFFGLFCVVMLFSSILALFGTLYDSFRDYDSL